MQIDRESIQKLLTLNDFQLKMVLGKIAKESGIDPAAFNINTNDIASIRKALSMATDADLKKVTEIYENYKKSRGM